MQQSTYILSPLLALLSLFTAVGIMLHGTQIDKATVTAVDLTPYVSRDSGQVSLHGDAHTHSNSGSSSQALRDMGSSNHQIQPRRSEYKHSVSGRKLPKDTYSDNAN